MAEQREGSKNIKILVGLFIAIVICVVFLQSMGTSIQGQTATINAANETINITTIRGVGQNQSVNTSIFFTLANAPLLTNKSAITGFAMRNTSGFTITSGNYTINLNNGTLGFLNTTYMGGNVGAPANTGNTTALVVVDYTYQSLNYVSDGASNSMIGMIMILSVVGLIVVVITFVFKFPLLNKIFRRGQ